MLTRHALRTPSCDNRIIFCLNIVSTLVQHCFFCVDAVSELFQHCFDIVSTLLCLSFCARIEVTAVPRRTAQAHWPKAMAPKAPRREWRFNSQMNFTPEFAKVPEDREPESSDTARPKKRLTELERRPAVRAYPIAGSESHPYSWRVSVV